MPELFSVFDYSLWKAIFGKYVTVMCTYAWTHMDIFVMIISVGLSDRMSVLNDNLKRICGHQISEEFFIKCRMQYRKLCDLVEFIDDNISHLTFISFANNLFFVCVQLLKTLRYSQIVACKNKFFS